MENSGNEYDVWQVAGQPFRIQYHHQTLQELRALVWSGRPNVLGLSGYLFGSRDESTVTIAKIILVPDLGDALPGSKSLQQFGEANLQLLGWCRIHPGNGIELSGRELHFYNEAFPHPQDIALILEPSFVGSLRAGFFFRERSGFVRSLSSYLEILVEPEMSPLALTVQPTVAIQRNPRSFVAPAVDTLKRWRMPLALAASGLLVAVLAPRLVDRIFTQRAAAPAEVRVAPPRQDERRLQDEVQRLREALNRSDAHSRRLEALVTVLKERDEHRPTKAPASNIAP